MDWRTLMQAQTTHPQYPQYPQKGVKREGFEDFGDIEHKTVPAKLSQAGDQPDAKVSPLEPGCIIHWQGMDGKIRGPVVVQEVTQFEGRTWVFVQYEGADRLLSELLITVVEPGESGHESAP